MITVRTWFAIVALVGGGLAAYLCVSHSFVPGLDDVKDPLGRPSALSAELVDSSKALDDLTQEMVPKHEVLATRISGLQDLDRQLALVVGDATELGADAMVLDDLTIAVAGDAGPLPPLIARVTSGAASATSEVALLGVAVDGVGDELAQVGAQLSTVNSNLATLGPLSASISTSLTSIEASSARLRPLAPLLGVTSGLTNLLHELLSGLLPQTGTGR